MGLEFTYNFSGDQTEREGVSTSYCSRSQLKNCLVRRLLVGVLPGQGVVVEGVNEVK
jgi:hypothetical protein